MSAFVVVQRGQRARDQQNQQKSIFGKGAIDFFFLLLPFSVCKIFHCYCYCQFYDQYVCACVLSRPTIVLEIFTNRARSKQKERQRQRATANTTTHNPKKRMILLLFILALGGATVMLHAAAAPGDKFCMLHATRRNWVLLEQPPQYSGPHWHLWNKFIVRNASDTALLVPRTALPLVLVTQGNDVNIRAGERYMLLVNVSSNDGALLRGDGCCERGCCCCCGCCADPWGGATSGCTANSTIAAGVDLPGWSVEWAPPSISGSDSSSSNSNNNNASSGNDASSCADLLPPMPTTPTPQADLASCGSNSVPTTCGECLATVAKPLACQWCQASDTGDAGVDSSSAGTCVELGSVCANGSSSAVFSIDRCPLTLPIAEIGIDEPTTNSRSDDSGVVLALIIALVVVSVLLFTVAGIAYRSQLCTRRTINSTLGRRPIDVSANDAASPFTASSPFAASPSPSSSPSSAFPSASFPSTTAVVDQPMHITFKESPSLSSSPSTTASTRQHQQQPRQLQYGQRPIGQVGDHYVDITTLAAAPTPPNNLYDCVDDSNNYD